MADYLKYSVSCKFHDFQDFINVICGHQVAVHNLNFSSPTQLLRLSKSDEWMKGRMEK